MGIMKDLYIEAMEELASEAEEDGQETDESNLGAKAHQIAIDRFAGMCDAAKDRAKYV